MINIIDNIQRKSLVFSLMFFFTKQEKNRFRKFLKSEYFNTDQFVVKLYDVLESEINRKAVGDENRMANIYNSVFNGKKTATKLGVKEKKLISTKLSVLLSLAKRFLIVEEVEKVNSVGVRFYYPSLFERKQLKLVEKELKKDKKKLESTLIKDEEYYDFGFYYESVFHLFLYHRIRSTKASNYNRMDFNLDMSYFLKKLKIYIEALSVTNSSKKHQYDFTSIEAIIPLIASPRYASHPLIQVYSKIILLNKEDSEEVYFEFVDILLQFKDEINLEDLNDFFIIALNFCTRKIVIGALIFDLHRFNLYKIMDKNNLLLQNGKMSINRLRNIVAQCCNYEDFDWALKLIDKYEDYYNFEDKKSVSFHNLSVIAFYKKDYKTAIDYYIRMSKVNLDYEVNSRMVMVKSYYYLDKEYDDRTMRMFRTTDQYIKNIKDLPTSYRSGYRNFINILINIYKLKHNIGKVTKQKIENKMTRMSFISDEKLLLEILSTF